MNGMKIIATREAFIKMQKARLKSKLALCESYKEKSLRRNYMKGYCDSLNEVIFQIKIWATPTPTKVKPKSLKRKAT